MQRVFECAAVPPSQIFGPAVYEAKFSWSVLKTEFCNTIRGTADSILTGPILSFGANFQTLSALRSRRSTSPKRASLIADRAVISPGSTTPSASIRISATSQTDSSSLTPLSARREIDACKAEQFDVTLLELLMPDKNGVECLIEMRKMRPDTKVAVVAGVNTSRLAQTAISEGAISVFAKPLDLNTFLPVLEDIAS